MSDVATDVAFWDDERGRDDRYDFTTLGLPANIAGSFALAFKVITGGYRKTSRRQFWLLLRRFVEYLRSGSDDALTLLSDPEVLLRYKEALVRQQKLQKTAVPRVNGALRIMRWLVENEDGPWRSVILFKGATATLSREKHRVRNNEVSPQLLHRIVSACKCEVDQFINKLSVRERVLRGEAVPSAELDGIRLDLLRQVLSLDAAQIYTQRDLIRVHRSGLIEVGMRRVEPFRALTNRTALPYYILLIVNTCGNPVGIMNLERDCVQPHPTDALKRRIYWGKGRSHREQAFDVLASGKYSAVRCVTDLLRLTEPIRHLASAIDVNKLMITRRAHKGRRVCVQSLHNALTAFRAQHCLPHFTFADLRKAAAVAIDEHAKSSKVVKKALQHKNGRTTRIYLQARRSVERRYEGVLQYQGQMLSLATAAPTKTPAPADTLAGIRCRDPLAGIAPGSTRNHPCLQWLECCRCPNAIVVRDDPVVIGRILRAAQSLRDMREQAATSAEATQHFESAFRPTLHVIETQILPRITKRVRVQAEAIAATLPALPLLE